MGILTFVMAPVRERICNPLSESGALGRKGRGARGDDESWEEAKVGG